MKKHTLYIVVVLTLVVGLMVLTRRMTPTQANHPVVAPEGVLVANLREANEPNDKLETGEPYGQDRTPGTLLTKSPTIRGGCSEGTCQ